MRPGRSHRRTRRRAELLIDLGPPEEQAAIVESLWRVDSPHVGATLDALATAHPHKQVAKAARRAAFKLRSASRRSPELVPGSVIATTTQAGRTPRTTSPS